MRLVVGLGNPGSGYAATRHNVGVRVLERFARAHGITLDETRFGGAYGRGALDAVCGGAPVEVGLLAPATFMNRSGDAVSAALSALAIDDPADLWVALDDVDLPFGRLRLRPGGGAGGHRGMTHIIERLGRHDFPRLRFGVGRPDAAMETADYVLRPFGADEEAALPALLAHSAEALTVALHEGVASAMNRFNRELDPADEAGGDS